jgi:hypothetical protein
MVCRPANDRSIRSVTTGAGRYWGVAPCRGRDRAPAGPPAASRVLPAIRAGAAGGERDRPARTTGRGRHRDRVGEPNATVPSLGEDRSSGPSGWDGVASHDDGWPGVRRPPTWEQHRDLGRRSLLGRGPTRDVRRTVSHRTPRNRTVRTTTVAQRVVAGEQARPSVEPAATGHRTPGGRGRRGVARGQPNRRSRSLVLRGGEDRRGLTPATARREIAARPPQYRSATRPVVVDDQVAGSRARDRRPRVPTLRERRRRPSPSRRANDHRTGAREPWGGKATNADVVDGGRG